MHNLWWGVLGAAVLAVAWAVLTATIGVVRRLRFMYRHRHDHDGGYLMAVALGDYATAAAIKDYRQRMGLPVPKR